jgi:NAD(P)H dehydrogenase (quinone)
MSAPVLAVTGVTGGVGGLTARDLADRGLAQRLLVRTPANAPKLPSTSVHAFSFADLAACRGALTGVDVVFMVSASESADRLDQHRSFVDAAKQVGVRHIVYTSFLGAAEDATFTLARDHAVTEQYIVDAGLEYTFLRDAFYIDFMESMVGADGVLRGPAGDGRVAIVTRADVARCAADILADPAPHAGRAYDVTGPEALTMAEIADTISRVRGREVSFHNETVEEAYRSRRGYDAPSWQLDAWVSTYTAIAAGELATVSGDVHAVTGRRPQSLEEFLLAHPR